MTMILCTCLVALMMFVLLIRNKDVMSPTFLSIVVFLLASLALLYREQIWGIKLSIDTVFLIIFALISMLMGELLSIAIGRKLIGNCLYIGKPKFYIINKKIIIAEIFLGMVVCFIYWKYIKVLAASAGVGSGNILWDARVAMLSGNSAAGTFINILKTIIIMFSIFVIYIFINNKFYEKFYAVNTKSNYILVTIIPSIFLIIFDTGRTEFIRLISISFVCYLLFNKYFFKNNMIKFAKKGLYFFIGLILVFWFVGLISNKNGSYSIIDNLAKYIGSGIAGLDYKLDVGIVSSKVWGENTFRGVRQTLNIFFHDIQVSNNVLTFVVFADGEMTNIYTAIYEYYMDFGTFGMLVIFFLQGLFLGIMYKMAKNKGPGIWALLYIFYSYTIFRQITAADFLTSYFGVTHIIAVFTLIFAYKMCIKNN